MASQRVRDVLHGVLMVHYDLLAYRSMDYLIDGVSIHFSETQRYMFALLYNARGAWVYKKSLINLMPRWDEKPPLTLNKLIHVIIDSLRRKLKTTRFRIENNNDYGYRFVRI